MITREVLFNALTNCFVRGKTTDSHKVDCDIITEVMRNNKSAVIIAISNPAIGILTHALLHVALECYREGYKARGSELEIKGVRQNLQ